MAFDPTMRLTLFTHSLGLALLVVHLALPVSVMGRLMEGPTYQEMFAKADLVVIGKPVSSKDTSEHSRLPGWDAIHVVGINTEFETRLVLKGDKDLKNFVLHHYRIDRVAELQEINDDPTLANFDRRNTTNICCFWSKSLTVDTHRPAARLTLRSFL
jgi:hypothetical protein